jgi:hypothetical protein
MFVVCIERDCKDDKQWWKKVLLVTQVAVHLLTVLYTMSTPPTQPTTTTAAAAAVTVTGKGMTNIESDNDSVSSNSNEWSTKEK